MSATQIHFDCSNYARVCGYLSKLLRSPLAACMEEPLVLLKGCCLCLQPAILRPFDDVFCARPPCPEQLVCCENPHLGLGVQEHGFWWCSLGSNVLLKRVLLDAHNKLIDHGKILDLQARVQFALQEFEGSKRAGQFVGCDLGVRSETWLPIRDIVFIVHIIFFRH